MTPPENDWSEFIPPARPIELTNRVDTNAVELAGHWKHGYIPLDAAAWYDKTKGVRGGTKWWDGPDLPRGGNKPAKKMLTSKEVPSAGFKARPKKKSTKPNDDGTWTKKFAFGGKNSRRTVVEQRRPNSPAGPATQSSSGPSVVDRARFQELDQKKKLSGLSPKDRVEHARLQASVRPDKTAADTKTSAAAATGGAKNAARGQAAAAATIRRGRTAAIGRKGELEAKTKNKIPLNAAERAELAALNSYLGKA
jgi:hypothetical protein